MFTMTIDPRLLEMIRPEAERLAREWYARWADCDAIGFDKLPGKTRRQHIAAQASLLVDLSRPASMDFAARLLAERVGLVCGATAPEWALRFPRSDGLGFWTLSAGDDEAYWTSEHWADAEGVYDESITPGISALTDPAAALLAALLATVPR